MTVRTPSLLDRLYFSPLRCMPGHRYFIASGLVLAIVTVTLRLTAVHHGRWGGIAVALQIAAAAGYALLVLLRYGWSYPGTNMIAHGNGRNRWTIHMGPAVSLLPWYYARQHPAFITEDIYRILHRMDDNGQVATVRLESHLLADDATRRAGAARLRRTFPHWQVTDQLNPAPLAALTAWQLTRLHAALRRRRGEGPPAPFRAGAPVGLIVVEVGPALPAALSRKAG
ncbi:hypothetical protein [Pseudoduganella chitinolytica]|uniref:Uncharacterized protein n=1 Tax=Pseudoduganella chitinolytica TaxID=34070 RepID=A0ABY8BBS6_9BURK|nr:hypothetical protein [Pseudoduganella chitinolytica]WEF33357.1 hypothetical protein PX653_00765 [Pseudoduganella chitinolytica]